MVSDAIPYHGIDKTSPSTVLGEYCRLLRPTAEQCEAVLLFTSTVMSGITRRIILSTSFKNTTDKPSDTSSSSHPEIRLHAIGRSSHARLCQVTGAFSFAQDPHCSCTSRTHADPTILQPLDRSSCASSFCTMRFGTLRYILYDFACVTIGIRLTPLRM